MLPHEADSEVHVFRRVFPTWSIDVPESFLETVVDEGSDQGYWHAWDAHRSISMTSVVLTDGSRPVTAAELMEQLPAAMLVGTPVERLPPGVVGVAVTAPSIPPARASTLLSGILAIDGRVLLVTITADDLGWARRIFDSIRAHPVEVVLVH